MYGLEEYVASLTVSGSFSSSTFGRMRRGIVTVKSFIKTLRKKLKGSLSDTE